MTTHYRTTTVDGLRIFYREAGDPELPALLLLHGFPASSFMFRRLIDLTAHRFRVIAPDYPGFGHSEAPQPGDFSYTFDRLADVIDGFTTALGLTRYGLYLQDFGGPVGFRLATRHPERVSFLVIQNANTYDQGLPDSFWAPARRLWAEPSQENREAIRSAAMSDAALEWNYTHGTADPSRIDPDSWLLQQALLSRPGNKDAMLDLLYDYRTNPPRYPAWHSYGASRVIPRSGTRPGALPPGGMLAYGGPYDPWSTRHSGHAGGRGDRDSAAPGSPRSPRARRTGNRPVLPGPGGGATGPAVAGRP